MDQAVKDIAFTKRTFVIIQLFVVTIYASLAGIWLATLEGIIRFFFPLLMLYFWANISSQIEELKNKHINLIYLRELNKGEDG